MLSKFASFKWKIPLICIIIWFPATSIHVYFDDLRKKAIANAKEYNWDANNFNDTLRFDMFEIRISKTKIPDFVSDILDFWHQNIPLENN